MSISNQASGVRTGVCTSTTRPTAPYTGQVIFETDTTRSWVYDGTAWRFISGKVPYCHCLQLSADNLTLSGTAQAITLNAERYDTDNFHSTTSNPTRFTIPAGLGGLYMVEARVMINYSAMPTALGITVRQSGNNNDSQVITGNALPYPVFAGTSSISGLMYLADGAYIEMLVSISGGSSVTTLGSSTGESCTGMKLTRIGWYS